MIIHQGTSMGKPTCFIAMAFGKEDTDQLYDKQIRPALDRLGITAVIINRVESNDDLNIQIIKQLKTCDFCIADLTYTRPSVYFEAGYAQRAVEVIYTVRKDHLVKGQEDDLRVHFDLQMKPLITWASPENMKFSRDLEKRIKSTFLQDWLQKTKVQEEENKAIKEYNSKSSSHRVFLLQKSAMRFMETKGYKIWHTTDKRYTSSPEHIQSGKVLNVYSYKIEKSVLHITTVQSYQSALKKDLEKLQYYYGHSLFILRLDLDLPKNLRVFNYNHIVLSLNPIPKSRIEGVFPHHKPLKSLSNYYFERELRDNPLFRKNSKYKNSLNFIFGMKSIPELEQKLSDLSDYLLI